MWRFPTASSAKRRFEAWSSRSCCVRVPTTGSEIFPLEAKIAAVMRQLDRGEAVVVFDPDTETVSIVVASPPSRRARIDDSVRDKK